jgi:hypothetical protein
VRGGGKTDTISTTGAALYGLLEANHQRLATNDHTPLPEKAFLTLFKTAEGYFLGKDLQKYAKDFEPRPKV